MFKRFAATTAALTLLLAGASTARAQAVTAVTKLDENTLAGAWYEVAHLPSKRDTKKCMKDMVEVIALGEKRQLQIVDSCTTPKGYSDASNRTAKQDKAGDGKLKIPALIPFAKKYWILAQGSQNEWFLVGSPNHKTLAIYSKTPTLPPDVLMQIEAKAAAESFPVAKLVTVNQ
jgi:apolipoprotein D and lipocalin family protein